jgi:hypothetical protein
MCHPLWIRVLWATLACTFFVHAQRPEPEQRPVQVFVLAGQSNMEGKAKNSVYNEQLASPDYVESMEPFCHDGEWEERRNVFVKFGKRHGKLNLGFGSPGRTGVELAFGNRMGFDVYQPVLLIKTAWGGRSLYRDFRPPSAGLPSGDELKQELKQQLEKFPKQHSKERLSADRPTMEQVRAAYGRYYRAMIQEVQDTLKNCDELFPELKGKPKQLSGFVWFHGWNDQYGGVERHYEALLRHLIDDVRKDMEAPELPVVIGVMGQNGPKPAQGAMRVIQRAQLAVAADERYAKSVRAVRTDKLVDIQAWMLYPDWQKKPEKWALYGSDHPITTWGARSGPIGSDSLLPTRCWNS